MPERRIEAARRWEARWRRLAAGEPLRGAGDRALAAALWAATPFYQAGAALHRLASRPGRAGAPVVSVGNLSVGGAGKTPLVEWLARRLGEAGLRPAILSRGYGGRFSAENPGGALLVSDGGAILAEAAEAGDEPVELARALPGVAVAVARRRLEAARLLEARLRTPPGVFLLDDGFQHYALARDFDLVALDASSNPEALARFPRGPLREGLEALRRAHAVVLTRCEQIEGGPEAALALAGRLRQRFPHLTIARTQTELLGLASAEGALTEPREALRGARVALFCATGAPEAIRRALERAGAAVALFRPLPDHAAAGPEFLTELRKEAARLGVERLVCTRKDAVKLAAAEFTRAEAPIRILLSRIVFCDSGEEAELTRRILEAARRG